MARLSMSYALWPVIFIYSSLRIFSWKMRMYWHAFVVSCIFVLYKKTCMYIKKIVYVTAENPKKKKEKNIKRCPSDQDWTNHVSIRCQSKNSSSLGWNFGLARAAGFLFFFFLIEKLVHHELVQRWYGLYQCPRNTHPADTFSKKMESTMYRRQLDT